ncbi:MAG: hypothetical protein KC621_04995 [Myxococcales bacterium]|nr:hypothetical protein [Myxococcales bacterium]
MWAFWAIGCIWSDFDEALDYRIDRTIIPAMRMTPRVAPGGVERIFEALVLAPRPAGVPRWEVCGLYEGRIARIGDLCFEEASLVTVIGEGATISWVPPPIDVDCTFAHSGVGRECLSSFPVRAIASGPDGVGRAILPLTVVPDDGAVWELPGPVPVRIEVVEGTPAPGAEVLLQATTRGDDRDQPFRWYVDDGLLLGTGRTEPWTVGAGLVTARNRLRIPEGYEGDLRVAVVVEQEGEMSWVVSTLVVTP